MVVLNVLVEVESSQRLWQGKLKDCGVLFGMNALLEHDFQLFWTKAKGDELGLTLGSILQQTVHLFL